jgi:toxin YoeB
MTVIKGLRGAEASCSSLPGRPLSMARPGVRRQLKRINQLILACLREAFVGIGKPEPLRENLSGCWSRRIDDEHRLIYRLEGTTLVILACRYHDR